MIYLGAYGYAEGNISNIFRGIDSNGVICGIGATASYPYLYLTNPYSDITKKACVNTCPSWTGSAVSAVTCSDASLCNSGGAYNIEYDLNGNRVAGSGTPAASDYLGYDTYLTLDRICVPNANMFTTIFSSVSDSYSSAMSSGKLANFINDIKNVICIRFRTGNSCWLLQAWQYSSPSLSCSCCDAA